MDERLRLVNTPGGYAVKVTRRTRRAAPVRSTRKKQFKQKNHTTAGKVDDSLERSVVANDNTVVYANKTVFVNHTRPERRYTQVYSRALTPVSQSVSRRISVRARRRGRSEKRNRLSGIWRP